ncbi:hypothetical protein [Planctomycetes bacterium K23_9]|uniref:Uncharacterized protein n=1 Tax=Stieleria marina TaxID=1930275 RepID=A0A517NZM8_9BACT|nr:hypothetical protein K239x_45900 [Planctomycetes bacterium K23_9]
MQTATLTTPRSSGNRSNPPPTSGPSGCGYSIWQFDGSQWQLKKNCAIGDAQLGEPPAMEGKFKGQLRSTACVVA